MAGHGTHAVRDVLKKYPFAQTAELVNFTPQYTIDESVLNVM